MDKELLIEHMASEHNLTMTVSDIDGIVDFVNGELEIDNKKLQKQLAKKEKEREATAIRWEKTARKLSFLPDKLKMLAFAKNLGAMETPEFEKELSKQVFTHFMERLVMAAREFKTTVEEL